MKKSGYLASLCPSRNSRGSIETTASMPGVIWLDALIATELIQVTENTSAILLKSPPPDTCLKDHQALRATALAIAEKYHKDTALARHLGKHQ